MSPVIEPTVLDLRQYTLRHVGPEATVFPNTPGQQFTILNRSDFVARPLPVSNIPNTIDFASGTWTGRLNDSGDGSITFPNRESSDGLPWRLRFDPTNKLHWIEIYVDAYLDSVLCVTKVAPDRGQVVVSGYDGLQMTKSAYVRDWNCTQAPRDVIERGTQLWVPVVTDGFPVGTLNPQWTPITATGGTVSIGASGGCLLNLTATSGSFAGISFPAGGPSGTTWSVETSFQTTSSLISRCEFNLIVTEPANSATYTFLVSQFSIGGGVNALGAQISVTGGASVFTVIPAATNYGLLLESDGEWVSGYVNGQLIGALRHRGSVAGQISTSFNLTSLGGAVGAVNVLNVLAEMLQPFLMRGADRGDYVLPGSATTYPVGGLHGRYFNDLDLQSDTGRLQKIHAPSRTQAYASSGVSEYIDQQDATINLQSNPLPGAAPSNWSAIWFGSIYLKLSAGDYSMSITTPGVGNTVVRVWVGKTKFGDQLVDSWAWAGATATFFTVSAATLAGTLGYGAGSVVRDGWYPIKIEFAVDATALTAPRLAFSVTPAAYTDPGGTALASGAQNTTVPWTSLSPLGMIDQRYQGTSHFDLVQQTAQAVGYQFAVEPQSLESGLFPGVLAPRIREGHDTDVVLEPDDAPRREPIINYSSLLDGTDQASSVQGNGAGFQNGSTGQLQANVFDPATLQSALFDMQAWSDNAQASFSSLLNALLNSQLSNRLTPWQVVSGDPLARMRQSQTWPLPGTLSQMRWRPGDGVRVRAADINVYDSTPRQLLLVTRNLLPNGTASTQVSFAARPKSSAHANRLLTAAGLRPQRNYQRSVVSLSGAFVYSTVAAATLDGNYSAVVLLSGDSIISARCCVVINNGNVSFGIFVNAVDQTTAVNGPWTTLPVNADLMPVAAPDSSNRLFIQLKNTGAASTQFQYQLLVTVLR